MLEATSPRVMAKWPFARNMKYEQHINSINIPFVIILITMREIMAINKARIPKS